MAHAAPLRRRPAAALFGTSHTSNVVQRAQRVDAVLEHVTEQHAIEAPSAHPRRQLLGRPLQQLDPAAMPDRDRVAIELHRRHAMAELGERARQSSRAAADVADRGVRLVDQRPDALHRHRRAEVEPPRQVVAHAVEQ
jgi:hypothetical protein